MCPLTQRQLSLWTWRHQTRCERALNACMRTLYCRTAAGPPVCFGVHQHTRHVQLHNPPGLAATKHTAHAAIPEMRPAWHYCSIVPHLLLPYACAVRV